MKLCSEPRMQRKLLLGVFYLSLCAAAALYLGLREWGGTANPAAEALRLLSALGALLFLLTCATFYPVICNLKSLDVRRRLLTAKNSLLALQQELAPYDIMVVDRQHTVTYHNRRYLEIWKDLSLPTTGLSFAEALEPLLARLADPEPFLAKVRAVGSREGDTVSEELLLKDGRVLACYSSPLAGRDGRRHGRIWYLRDVTPRAAAERALRESEANFRGLLESSADGMVTVNEAQEIVMVNAEFESMFGYRREEVIGKNLGILVPRRFNRHREYVADFFRAPRKRLMGHGLKLVALRKDGSEFPVEIGLSPLATPQGLIVSAAIRDVTQRELAEKKALAAAAYARTLFEASPDPLLTISRKGVILDVNGAMVAITGSSRESLIGTEFAGHFTEPEKAWQVYREVFEEGLVRDFPLVLRALSGQVTEVLYNAVVYRDEGGEIAGAFAAARDMTLRKVVEDELRELNRTLEERVAERTESLLTQARELLEAATLLADASRRIRENANEAVTTAMETAAALNQTTGAIQDVKRTALNSSNKARNVSLAAQRSADVAKVGRAAIQGATGGMSLIQEHVGSSAESIIRLSEQGRAIGKIISTVSDLAEQSNLLAVNAAIEASKAGEQGRGFAVVAREVKHLSEQSKAATEQVRTILEDIRRATDGAVLISEQGKNSAALGVAQARRVEEAIREMEESIEISAQAALQIAASCQQQLIGVDQVDRAMESIRGACDLNVTGMVRLEATLKHLEELGEKLEQLQGTLPES